MKGKLKNKDHVCKSPVKKVLKFVASSVLTGALLATVVPAAVFSAVPVVDLPNQKQVEQRISDYDEVQEYYSITKNVLGSNFIAKAVQNADSPRLPCPKNSDGIKINVNFEANELQKEVIEESIAEFNKVFEVINPAYRFVINYSPDILDKLDPYSVDIDLANKLLGDDVLGHCLMKFNTSQEGLALYKPQISILKSVANGDRVYFMSVLKHEFLHALGVGDAYLHEDAPQLTLMQDGDSFFYDLTTIDVAILDAFYRSKDNQYSNKEIVDYVMNYNLTHNRVMMKLNEDAQILDEKLDSERIKESFRSTLLYYEIAEEDVEIEKIGDSKWHYVQNYIGALSKSETKYFSRFLTLTNQGSDLEIFSYDFDKANHSSSFSEALVFNGYYYDYGKGVFLVKYGDYLVNAKVSDDGEISISLEGELLSNEEFETKKTEVKERLDNLKSDTVLDKFIAAIKAEDFSSIAMEAYKNDENLKAFIAVSENLDKVDKTFGKKGVNLGEVAKYIGTPRFAEISPDLASKDGFVVSGTRIYFKIDDRVFSLCYDYDLSKDEITILKASGLRVFQETELSMKEYLEEMKGNELDLEVDLEK